MSPATQAEFESAKAWFREHGKDGEWTITGEELQALGAIKHDVLAVIRHVRKNNSAVTKEQFIELVLECSGKKAAGGDGIADAA